MLCWISLHYPSDRVTRFCCAKAHSDTRNIWILWIPKFGNTCIHVCMSGWLSVCLPCVCARVRACMRAGVHAFIYVYMYGWLAVCLSVPSACVCACMSVCLSGQADRQTITDRQTDRQTDISMEEQKVRSWIKQCFISYLKTFIGINRKILMNFCITWLHQHDCFMHTTPTRIKVFN